MFSQQKAPGLQQQQNQPMQPMRTPTLPTASPASTQDVLRHVPITAMGSIPIELQIALQPLPTFKLGANELCLHSGAVVDMVPRLEDTLAQCRAQLAARAQQKASCTDAWAAHQAGQAERLKAGAEAAAAARAAAEAAEGERRRKAEEAQRDWSCQVCTTLNSSRAAACTTCASARGTGCRATRKWPCARCTFSNDYLDEASGKMGTCDGCKLLPVEEGGPPLGGGRMGGGGAGGGFGARGAPGPSSSAGAWSCPVCSATNAAALQACSTCTAIRRV